MSNKTHGVHSTRRFVTAAVGLALVVTAAASRPLYGQVSQDSAKKKSPWDLPPSPVRTGLPQATSQVTADSGHVAADSGFIRQVGSMNLLEVRLGTLAGQRSSNATVKQFAQQMVSSHSSMGQQWASLAEQNRLPTSAPMNSIQQRQAEQLSKLSGAEFDRAYMNAMVADHEQDAGGLQRIGTYAQSAEVKRLAANGLAATQQHLSRARQVASQVGAATAVATNPPSSAGSVGPSGSSDDKGGRADGLYAQEIAYQHITEIRLARMAQERAKNSEVKKLANGVASDFPKWQDRWTDLASRHGGVKVNPNVGPKHQLKIQRLQKASAGNFDQVYLDIMVADLGPTVRYLRKEGRASNAADIRKAAEDELPIVQEKLSTAQRLDRQVQANGMGKDKEKS
jgi:putative membrane protein